MIIRPATVSDLDNLLPLLEEAQHFTPFHDVPLDEDYTRRLLAIAVSMPNFFCEVVERKDGRIVGVLAGTISLNTWGVKVASDLVFYAKGLSHKLLENFRAWAERSGAGMLNITEITGNPRFCKLLEHSGLTKTGSIFTEDI